MQSDQSQGSPSRPEAIQGVEQFQTRLESKFAFLFEDKKRLKKRVAVTLIEESVWWLTHVHGPCRAPSFSKYISGDESTWHLTFGANTVHISKAVRDCRSALIGWAAELKSVPTAADWGRARSQIHSAARGAVTSFNGSSYGSYGDANRMAFGVHAIDLPDFTKSLGKLLGIVELSLVSHAPVRTNARRESVPSDLATCKLCGQFVRVSRLAKHLSDRCAKRPGQQSGH